MAIPYLIEVLETTKELVAAMRDDAKKHREAADKLDARADKIEAVIKSAPKEVGGAK